MTKKATSLLEKYEDKLDTVVWLASKGYETVDDSIKTIHERNKSFDDLITNMFHYDLLSENDFKELVSLSYKTGDKYIDMILGI